MATKRPKPPCGRRTWTDECISALVNEVYLDDGTRVEADVVREYADAERDEYDARLARAVAVCKAAVRWRECVNPPKDHADFMDALDTYLAGKDC